MKKYAYKRRDIKIVVSGDIVEVYEYRIPISVEKRDYEIIKGSLEKFEKREDNLLRARAEIRRYVWANITPYSKFLTLTYAKTQLDYDRVVIDMKYFFKNMTNNGYPNLPYLYVIEHQKERGEKEGNEGSLHVHCLIFFDEYIPFNVINRCWDKGGTDITKIDDKNNVGAYVCKYLSKEEFEICGKHSYHISRGLKKSEIYAHDGYIYEPDFAKSFLDEVDFYYCDTRNYDYTSFDGYRFENSVIYKQGRLKDNNILYKIKEMEQNGIPVHIDD